ncbi:lipopolysaccharide biosynthesis protein [Mucilaginibacter sp. UR6-1]|uniref:exopolysaccharide transport family protein n=1 Tax=Mucilaginibacter sp. UR6-1 TaxID=1435643 RepID=UPI001E5A2454|nr:Wzz/FepE/Etk N-terminal domain-containing protein [Mucilaginibacter sp. UR6-1]MCC8407396.1 lipopolysaccharide biosynthesis protein [Mucilaginibacter sp. UR6-1]
MEFGKFFKLLLKHKYTLIAIPVIAVVITYFLVRNQPDVFTSTAQLATGIVDPTQQVLSTEQPQESKISQEFSNLVQMLRSTRILDQVSYQLMLHDLTSDKPFRKPSDLLEDLNPDARKHAIQVYSRLYKNRQELSLFDQDQNGLNKVIESMRYDDQSLLKTLTIYRLENSDFINIQFDAENPELTAFVVNTLCKEFINYYTFIVKENQRKAATFLGKLLQNKQDSLHALSDSLKQYKIKNRVFSLTEQARSLYGQLSDYETRRQENEKDVVSTRAAIRRIDQSFDPADRQYVESSMTRVNAQITELDKQLNAANNAYIESDFDPAYKGRVDSLNNIISSKIRLSSDKYILNPLSAKQELVTSKQELQTANVVAKNSSKSINKELGRLNRRFDNLVPHEAVIGSYEKAIDIAQEEYLTLLAKYNQVSMEASMSVTLKQVVAAMPGVVQPSKKMLLVILAGIGSFAVCVVVLFALFFLDNTVKTAKDLANRTKIPVLGYLNLLDNKVIDFKKLWDSKDPDKNTRTFKNLLRSLRYEIDNEMQGDKLLLVNSLKANEGKTVIAVSLAYSQAVINKRVLLIDGNFEDSGITGMTKPAIYLEDYLTGKVSGTENTSGMLTVWGNRGGDVSLFEIRPEHEVKEKLDALKQAYDLIIIEASALNTLNRSKEWVGITDRLLTVFESGQNLTEAQKPNIQYLKSVKNKFMGWVLNKVTDVDPADRKA